MVPFLTGSHAYGTPTPESDIDVACILSAEDFAFLRDKAEKADGSNGDSLMFGKLNLIVLNGEKQYAAWKAGTDELKARKPVTREEAIRVLERCEKEFGAN